MRILVSACLMGETCKYNGGNNYSAELADFLCGNEVFAVCPEVMGGLKTPRSAVELVGKLAINKDGEDVSENFYRGANAVLDIAKREKIELAVLQSRSPSCGVKEIYDGTFSKKLISGQGVTAKLLIESGFKVIDIADLKNFRKTEKVGL